MKYLNAAQAAKRIGISDKTIRRWLKEGKISAIRTESGVLAIPESEVEALRRQRTQFVQHEEGQETASHDQTDIVTLAAKVAELEQELATLKQGTLPITEKPIEPSVPSSMGEDTTPKKKAV
jgi:excisionase family DNA binding protein